MKTSLISVTVTIVLAATTVLAEDPEIISISDGQLIVCSSYAATQTIYTLVANGQMENVADCWVVDAPMEAIILQGGPRISSITYREFTDDAEIARMVTRGASEAVVERARLNPWSPWYQQPAWAFSAWLETSE